MRAAEFLKTLIDLVDKGELSTNDNDEKSTDDTGNFMPPLQQELELLKKQNNVDSEFDEDEPPTPQQIKLR